MRDPSRVETYDADRYWRDALAGSFDLQGVGLVNRSLSFNRWGYRGRRAAVTAMAPDVRGLRVLDVGSGTGHWIAYWHSRGAASVAGLDLTDVSVTRLRESFPGDRIERADVCDGIPFAGPFDLVSAMDVLLHVTAEDRYRRALAHLRGVVEPGARLILIEPLTSGPARPMAPGAHSKTRRLRDVAGYLAEAGWRLAATRSVTWLMSNPVEVRPRLVYGALTLWWGALRPVVRTEAGGRFGGAVVYAADRLLCRVPGWGPSSKIAVAEAM
ncbi:MAG TPA: class I SAM-dependent methyltransferase [Terriglobales bacterium]|nr:class I SAM-dependent methyltransferase [Terriglobales bacterium]